MGGGDGLFEIEIYIPKMNVITFAPKKNTRGNRCMLEGQHDPLLKTHSLMLTNIPQWCWMSWERLCMGVGVGGTGGIWEPSVLSTPFALKLKLL